MTGGMSIVNGSLRETLVKLRIHLRQRHLRNRLHATREESHDSCGQEMRHIGLR